MCHSVCENLQNFNITKKEPSLMASSSSTAAPSGTNSNVLSTVVNNKNANVNNNAASTIASQLFATDKSTATTTAINKAFRELIKDPKYLDEAANCLYSSLLDDAIVGVFIEIHHLHKTGNLSALDGVPEEDQDTSFRIVDMPNFDIFGISTAKKPMDCTCPNCDRPVSAARFAPHLEKCMGMGRISSRIASRRLATKEGTSASSSSSSSYLQTNAGTDDEDDVDWSSEKRRKKTSQNSRNGSKKNNGKSF